MDGKGAVEQLTETNMLLQNRNEVLMTIMEEVDHLLQWGKVYQARVLLLDYIVDDDETIELRAKGEPMPQTIAHWKRLYGLAEQAMLRDKHTISQLKSRVNDLENKLKRGS